jgi:hypothetical protein
MTRRLLFGPLAPPVIALDHIGGAMARDMGDCHDIHPSIEQI